MVPQRLDGRLSKVSWDALESFLLPSHFKEGLSFRSESMSLGALHRTSVTENSMKTQVVSKVKGGCSS